MRDNHFSYYINVGQTIGIIGGLYTIIRAIKLEEQKAGIEHRTFVEVVCDDILKIKDWYEDNFKHVTYEW